MHQGELVRRAVVSALGCGFMTIGLATSAHTQCQLNSPTGKIKHLVYIEFDNVHFTRDNPNVPSDLEQMPNLLNFITQNGTLDAGDHTVLISHTANDILTTEVGLYSDHHGIFVANSFGVFEPGASKIAFPSSFFYWTDKVSDITPATMDETYALTTPSGKNVPAPWVPFTRAGCDVGAFSTANIVLERTPFDVQKVFGAGSTQAAESSDDQFNDFVGAAIHCAEGSSFCAAENTPVNDSLPDEPGGYNGYQALFGLKYVAPALLIDLSQAMCLETKGFRFSDAGSSDLRLGKGIQLIMKALAMAMFFAYSALFFCNPLIINKLLVEAAGVEPDISVENAQVIDSGIARIGMFSKIAKSTVRSLYSLFPEFQELPDPTFRRSLFAKRAF